MTVYRWFMDTDHDARQSLAVEVARGKHDQAARLADALPDVATSRHKAQALRLDRSELVIETMFRYLLEKGLIDLEEFGRMLHKVDLEDGVEDGRIGSDRSEHAPKCPMCEKPYNPARSRCVYCGVEISEEHLAQMKPLGGQKIVVCISCYRRVPEENSTRTIDGPLCKRCSG